MAAVAGGAGGQPPYLHVGGSQDDVKAATHWVVADIATQVPARVARSTVNRPGKHWKLARGFGYRSCCCVGTDC